MSSIFAILWKMMKWFGLCGGLMLMLLSALAEPVDAPPSAWDGPLFVQDHWELTGIVEHGLQTHWRFEQELDLVEVRYGRGSLWALAGLVGADGQYASLMKGITSRQALDEVFHQPRYITLTMPGTPVAVDHTPCRGNPSSRCQVTALVEGSRPPIILNMDEEPTGDLSNIFIQTSVFPRHDQYGFLTWDIQPGRVIEQGLEGG